MEGGVNYMKNVMRAKNITKIVLAIIAVWLISETLNETYSSYMDSSDNSDKENYYTQLEEFQNVDEIAEMLDEGVIEQEVETDSELESDYESAVNESDDEDTTEVQESLDGVLESSDEVIELNTPSDLVLNRGHIEDLAFGGPIGLSWSEVENRETFTVFVFRNASENNPNEAYAHVDDIDALHLNVNTALAPADLSNGPFWFRVQAVADTDITSILSEPVGPFWYAYHSDRFAQNPIGSLTIFNNANIPVIVLDTRTPGERAAQGNIVGDAHVPWPNATGVEQGITHASFQNAVLDAWERFIATELTEAQQANLDPGLDFRDIHIFVY